MKKAELSRIRIPAREQIRFAVVADLHGTRVPEAMHLLRETRPELILCPGDLFEYGSDPTGILRGSGAKLHRALRTIDRFLGPAHDRESLEGIGNTMEFLREMCEIAPVFCSAGNHDLDPSAAQRQRYADAGAVLLGEEPVTLELPGGMVSLAGAYRIGERRRAELLDSRPGLRILLCHRPELFHPMLDGLNTDLMVAGHAHGGQWRLFGRGVYAPGQGFFPKYTKGFYEGRLLVTAGLANNSNLPRLNDPPEVLLVETGEGRPEEP